ncbi:glutathione S-transferase family protein [Azohydromonas lata]|uniref:glutathione S-transferase family protein n=1 Tax=Azohydromonas lata TaxID=45677 RepID=UPI0008335CC3|nr:glutathione S-transferase family protein [Azohydromonas lata]
MLTLYHAPGSVSSRIAWLLEELGAMYELVNVADPYSTGGRADARNPHPHGFTPALDHDGRIVTETGAIALYLTDLFPNAQVGVPAGDALRGRYLTWLFYQVGLTEPLVYMKGTQALSRDAAMARLDAAMMQHIEATLAESGPYLLGERFTAADILMMSLFEQARALLGASPSIDAYLALADRPARRRALQRDKPHAPSAVHAAGP